MTLFPVPDVIDRAIQVDGDLRYEADTKTVIDHDLPGNTPV